MTRHGYYRSSRLLVLLVIAGIVCPAMADHTNIKVDVTGLDKAGLFMTSPTAPDFDSRVAALLPSWVPQVLSLKPCILIISNRSPKTVVAYTLEFQFSSDTSILLTSRIHSKSPAAVANGALATVKGNELRPGSEKVVGVAFEGEPQTQTLAYYQQTQEEDLLHVTHIRISFDAVLFDDGSFIGPDRAELRRSFEVYLDEQQALYHKFAQALDTGTSLETAFHQVVSPVFDLPIPRPGDAPAVYANVAAQDAIAIRKRFGDEAAAEMFRHAVRDKPFVIRPADISKESNE
jgi:hypothetical protein